MPVHKAHQLITRILFGTPGDWASRNQPLIFAGLGAVGVLAAAVTKLVSGAL